MREAVWTFRTARFRVELQIEPEDMDPADSFEFQEDIDAVRNGAVEWFQAIVVVYCDDRKVAWDSLGGCAYQFVSDFFTAHRDPDPMNRNCSIMRRAWNDQNDPDAKISICHYFPGMVREACNAARAALANTPRLRA